MSLLDLLIPPACSGCGQAGALLCGVCRSAIRPLGLGEDRFVVADAGIVIGDALILAMAGSAHHGPMRRALAALKYAGVARLAPLLARSCDARFRELISITGPAELVPIPVHVERRRGRGYNQAELIARALAARHSLPVRDRLVRSRPTTRQHRLSRAARLANLRGAFAMADDAALPAAVILVDDILTTSATLETCAAVLRRAGCAQVYGFAVAREV